MKKRIAVCSVCGRATRRFKGQKHIIICECGASVVIRTEKELGEIALKKMGLSEPKMLKRAVAVVAPMMWALGR